MTAVLHEPVLRSAGELSPELRDRILGVARRALARAAAAAPEAAIVTVLGGEEREPARERAGAGATAGGTVLVPSFGQSGARVPVPVARTITTGSGDRVVSAAFPDTTVITGSRSLFVIAGGRPFVVAGNLARADAWGRALFHETGYAVLQEAGAGRSDPFYVVGLHERLEWSDFDREVAPAGPDPQPAGRGGRMTASAEATPVYVETGDGVRIVDLTARTGWSHTAIARELAAVPGAEAELTAEDLDRAGEGLVSLAGREGGDASVEAIVRFDRTVFAAMPWDVRERYLELLVDAWTGEREELAILEIVHATRSVSELEAIFALLREHDVHRRLFRDLDGRVIDLLRTLARFAPGEAPGASFLIALLVDAGLLGPLPLAVAGVGPPPLRELQRLAEGAEQWLEGMWDGIHMLFTEPGKVLAGLGHLAELLWVLERARNGDREAMLVVERMAESAAAATLEAYRGLAFAEELGTPSDARGTGERVGGDLIGRLRAAIALEVLSWFVGVGEVKEALTGLNLGERISALARVLGRIGAAGRAGGAAEDVARFAAILARAAEVEDAARAARALELLPPAHLEALGRLAGEARLGADAGIEAVRTALAGRAELLADVDELVEALRAAGALEAKAAAAGIALREVAPAFRRLLAEGSIGGRELAAAIEAVPAERLPQLADTLGFFSPDVMHALSAADLGDLAARPAVMALAREAGGEFLATVLTRAGNDWDAVGRLAEGLAARRRTLPDPQAVQRLLDRVRQGDAAALRELEQARHGERLAAAEQAGRLPGYAAERLRERGRSRLLEELEDMDPGRARDLLTDELARLPESELDGLEELARLDGEDVDFGSAVETLRGWNAADRTDLLELLGELGPRTDSGLESVLHSILERDVSRAGMEVSGATGSFGELYAARTALRRFGAQRLHFQIPFPGRQVDVIAEGGPAGRLFIEVKTNLMTQGGVIRGEVIRDIVDHAGTGYRDLRYLYHPNVTPASRELLGGRMLRLFDDDAVQAGLRAAGHDVAAAREAFRHWLAEGGLGAYEL